MIWFQWNWNCSAWRVYFSSFSADLRCSVPFQLAEVYFWCVLMCVFMLTSLQIWHACTSCSAGFPMGWRPCVSVWAHTCGSRARPWCQRKEKGKTLWTIFRYGTGLSVDIMLLKMDCSDDTENVLPRKRSQMDFLWLSTLQHVIAWWALTIMHFNYFPAENSCSRSHVCYHKPWWSLPSSTLSLCTVLSMWGPSGN